MFCVVDLYCDEKHNVVLSSSRIISTSSIISNVDFKELLLLVLDNDGMDNNELVIRFNASSGRKEPLFAVCDRKFLVVIILFGVEEVVMMFAKVEKSF